MERYCDNEGPKLQVSNIHLWSTCTYLRDSSVLPSSDKVLVLALDVKVIQSITTAIDIGIRTFGRIDVLVNCCGEMQLGLFESIPPQKVLAQFETNVIGAFISGFRSIPDRG